MILICGFLPSTHTHTVSHCRWDVLVHTQVSSLEKNKRTEQRERALTNREREKKIIDLDY